MLFAESPTNSLQPDSGYKGKRVNFKVVSLGAGMIEQWVGVGRVLVLHAVDPGSITGIPYGSLSSARNEPSAQSQQ